MNGTDQAADITRPTDNPSLVVRFHIFASSTMTRYLLVTCWRTEPEQLLPAGGERGIGSLARLGLLGLTPLPPLHPSRGLWQLPRLSRHLHQQVGAFSYTETLLLKQSIPIYFMRYNL